MTDVVELSESRSEIEKENEVIEIKDTSTIKKYQFIIALCMTIILGLCIALGIVSYRSLNNGNNNNNNSNLNYECPESNVILDDSDGHAFNLAEYIHNIQNDLGVNMSFSNTYQLIDDFLDDFSSLSSSLLKNQSDNDNNGLNPSNLHEVENLDIYTLFNETQRRRLSFEGRFCSDLYGRRGTRLIISQENGLSIKIIEIYYTFQINGICTTFTNNIRRCFGYLNGNLYIAFANSGFCQVEIFVSINYVHAIKLTACNGFMFPRIGGPGGSSVLITPFGGRQLDAIAGFIDDNDNTIITALAVCYSFIP